MKRFLIGCLFAAAAFAQSADTGILGTVTDQSGSVMAGAAVTITSPAIGFRKSVVTAPDGQYEVRYLLPEDYTVEVRVTGFRPERTAGITLRIGQLARVKLGHRYGIGGRVLDLFLAERRVIRVRQEGLPKPVLVPRKSIRDAMAVAGRDQRQRELLLDPRLLLGSHRVEIIAGISDLIPLVTAAQTQGLFADHGVPQIAWLG